MVDYIVLFDELQKDNIINYLSASLARKQLSKSKLVIYSYSYDASIRNYFFCLDTIQVILNLRKTRWRKLMCEAKKAIKLKEKLEKGNYNTNNNLSNVIVKFINELRKAEGEYHATRFVRETITLQL